MTMEKLKLNVVATEVYFASYFKGSEFDQVIKEMDGKYPYLRIEVTGKEVLVNTGGISPMYNLSGSVLEDYALLKSIVLLKEHLVNDDDFKMRLSVMKDIDHLSTYIKHIMFYVDRFDDDRFFLKTAIEADNPTDAFEIYFKNQEHEDNAYTMELIRCFVIDPDFEVCKTYISRPDSRYYGSGSSRTRSELPALEH